MCSIYALNNIYYTYADLLAIFTLNTHRRKDLAQTIIHVTADLYTYICELSFGLVWAGGDVLSRGKSGEECIAKK